MPAQQTAEHQRLADSQARKADWKHWGPYLSERAWGTVREDYSATGEAWDYFPHDHARSRAYRWNEDGLAGFCNRFQNACLALALWNEQDPILKERLFGLAGPEGNHGEDLKEYYFYLDGTPTHSYMKMLYKYPQVEFPYTRLAQQNRHRGRDEPEFELLDALREAFEENRYFDVFIEYAKADQEDILCRISVVNRGPDPAPVHVLPHLWYRNTWSWGYGRPRPELRALDEGVVYAHHRHLGERWWYVDGNAPLLGVPVVHMFTENETNSQRLFGVPNASPYVKDGINEAVVHGRGDRVNPEQSGTKVAAHFQATVEPGETFTVRVRFTNAAHDDPFTDFDAVFEQRIRETDEFYAAIQRPGLSEDERRVQRQALAGLLWTKQFYHYSVELWVQGDPAGPPPPASRLHGRNADWTHLYALDVLSMPDKWEYPWFAAWDLAFHTVPLAMVDPEWVKRQLILLLREWYMHPNGQLPAYEWALGDVNPPVHAWAAWQVYQITREVTGHADTPFLERVFHKLLLNFTWWVNREDSDGHNVFQGGFLGLDNIGVFDHSAPLPTGGHLEQADGTAWMAMYCLNMLTLALELARTRPAYEDVATKFFEHFIYIANAFYDLGGHGVSLWDEEDGFFYDVLHQPDGSFTPLRIRSFVGLIPLLAVEALEPELLQNLPRFRRRMEWFLKYRPHMIANVAPLTETGAHGHHQLAIVGRDRLERVLARVFDPAEFLSDYGVRSLSRHHADHPFDCQVNGQVYTVRYEPAESRTGLFGGNSNWRGPIWFPINYLLIEALRKYHHHYGDTLKVEVPRGSGRWLTLGQAADELSRRLIRVPVGLKHVGVLVEPMSIVAKGIEQAYEIQRRLKVWQPRKAAVMGAGTIGLLATLGLRCRGLEVTSFALTPKPNLNASLVEDIGARYLSTRETSVAEAAEAFGPFDLIFEATGYSPLVFEAAHALAKNGVLILSSVTGGDRVTEVESDRLNLEFVLGNKVMFGTVNAHRGYFETAIGDFAKAEANWPGWLSRLLTHPIQGLDNYAEMFRTLLEAKDAIKVYVIVSEE